MNSSVQKISSKDLFQFIYPNENEPFSKMKGKDLQRLMVLLDNYYLPFRKDLGLDPSVSFGLELEFEHALRNRIEEEISSSSLEEGWKVVSDASLEEGAEINSPILFDKDKSWEELERVCGIVQNYASISDRAGGHIHVGAHILGKDKDAWLRFLRLWSTYENVLFRFSYGDYLTARPGMKKYAAPISNLIEDKWDTFYEFYNLPTIILYLAMERYRAVNFTNTCVYTEDFLPRNTVEFRCPNGTLDPVIWQNNVNLFTKILLSSKNNTYDENLVEERHKKNQKEYMNLEWYDEIYLKPSLELCDIVFDNNLDKIHFLKQYLKSFEVRDKEENYPKAKVLTKGKE